MNGYKAGTKYCFHDICLGRVRTFELIFMMGAEVGGRKIILAVEKIKNSSGFYAMPPFYYIVVDGFIKKCTLCRNHAEAVYNGLVKHPEDCDKL